MALGDKVPRQPVELTEWPRVYGNSSGNLFSVFSCLGQPTCCEHAAPNGWRGRWFIFACLRVPAPQRDGHSFWLLVMGFSVSRRLQVTRLIKSLPVSVVPGEVNLHPCLYLYHNRLLMLFQIMLGTRWGETPLGAGSQHPSPVPHIPPSTSQAKAALEQTSSQVLLLKINHCLSFSERGQKTILWKALTHC